MKSHDHDLTTTYIFMQVIGCQDVVLFALPNAFITNKQQHVKAKQRCRDGVMSDFVSWCRHLVPFFFMKCSPIYIPLHFIEMIFPLVYSTHALLL